MRLEASASRRVITRKHLETLTRIKPNYNEMMQTDSKAVMQTLANDPAFVRELVQQALNTALEAEMAELLGASKSERTGARQGYRSGSYTRSLSMKVGTVELKVLQDRDGRFSTEVFKRYQRSEKALVSTLAALKDWVNRWGDVAGYWRLVDWVEENVEETFTVYRLPAGHRRRMKSTNMLERLNEEIRRRTRVVRIFPNEASCLRLIRAYVDSLLKRRRDTQAAAVGARQHRIHGFQSPRQLQVRQLRPHPIAT